MVTELFEACESLNSIVIPDGVITIALSTFDGCVDLRSVEIPKSVTSIENTAFRDCESIVHIKIPNSVTSIGVGAFRGCSLKEMVIPDSVKSIGKDAFAYCPSLTRLSIPKDLTDIGEGAFDYHHFQNIDYRESSLVEEEEPNHNSDFREIRNEIERLLSKENGISKYSIGAVADTLYKKYPRVLVNEVIMSVLSDQYLVD